MKTITISTKRNDQILDITEVIETHLREAPHEDGLCSIFVSHTTCALTTADLDPGTDLDFIDALPFPYTRSYTFVNHRLIRGGSL